MKLFKFVLQSGQDDLTVIALIIAECAQNAVAMLKADTTNVKDNYVLDVNISDAVELDVQLAATEIARIVYPTNNALQIQPTVGFPAKSISEYKTPNWLPTDKMDETNNICIL